jgi:hypothetical protein
MVPMMQVIWCTPEMVGRMKEAGWHSQQVRACVKLLIWCKPFVDEICTCEDFQFASVTDVYERWQ